MHRSRHRQADSSVYKQLHCILLQNTTSYHLFSPRVNTVLQDFYFVSVLIQEGFSRVETARSRHQRSTHPCVNC